MKYKIHARFWRHLITAVLAALLVLTLFGCEGAKPPVVQEGIVIEDETLSPYTEKVSATADATLRSLLNYYYEASGESAPDENTLAVRSARLREITEEHLLAEKDYLALLALLEEDGRSLIDTLTGISAGAPLDFSLLKRVYLSLTDTVGAEYLGDLTHALVLYYYDTKHEDCMTLFEETGKVYQKVKAEEYAAERTTFSQNVDKSDTRVLLSASLFFADLFSGGAFDEGAMELFTDEELLLFLKHLDLSSLTVGKDGWMLLFTYAADYIGTLADIPYVAKLFWSSVHAYGCDDAEELAARMDKVITLLSSVQARLDAKSVGYLRRGEHRALTEAIFAGMTEEDFTLLDEILSFTPQESTYRAVAIFYFGETYTAYADAVTVCTLEDVRAAIGTQSFYTALEGYLASISPAFSFLLSDERSEL